MNNAPLQNNYKALIKLKKSLYIEYVAKTECYV